MSSALAKPRAEAKPNAKASANASGLAGWLVGWWLAAGSLAGWLPGPPWAGSPGHPLGPPVRPTRPTRPTRLPKNCRMIADIEPTKMSKKKLKKYCFTSFDKLGLTTCKPGFIEEATKSNQKQP